jgi:hypothetical protein
MNDLDTWQLWLPIVVSAIVLFFASAAAWMVLPHHKPEWAGLPNEDALAKTIRDADVPPGQYMFPYLPNPSDMKSEEGKRRMAAGPHGTLYVWAGAPNTGVNMAYTVLYFLIVSAVLAYLATMALDRGANFMQVFRFVGTAGVLTYGSANILNGIWFRRRLLADIIDGAAYGLITGLIFAILWPGLIGASA